MEKAADAASNMTSGQLIVFNEDTFVDQMERLYDELDRYIGKRVLITGFIYRQDDFKANDFVTARYMITCCAADTQVVGVMCHTNQDV